jgi:hypothetical protein
MRVKKVIGLLRKLFDIDIIKNVTSIPDDSLFPSPSGSPMNRNSPKSQDKRPIGRKVYRIKDMMIHTRIGDE